MSRDSETEDTYSEAIDSDEDREDISEENGHNKYEAGHLVGDKSEERSEMRRHIVKNPQTMSDLFCMEKIREDETSGKLFYGVDRCVHHVKQQGNPRLSI